MRGDELIPNSEAKTFVGSNFQQYFFLFGMMIGKAVIEKILLNVNLSSIFLRSVLRKENGVNQLINFDEELFEQLNKIKRMKNVSEVN